MDNEKKEFGKWWMFLLALVVVSVGVLTMTGYLGKVTGTIVEREVFEQSYQKTAADKTRLATYRAQLAEVNSKLTYGNLDEATKASLEAQRSMLNVQIKSAEGAQ